VAERDEVGNLILGRKIKKERVKIIEDIRRLRSKREDGFIETKIDMRSGLAYRFRSR